MKGFAGLTVATLFVLTGASEVAGQSSSGGLRGTVRDASGNGAVRLGCRVVSVREGRGLGRMHGDRDVAKGARQTERRDHSSGFVSLKALGRTAGM